ncbi:hypothetical protein EJ06DRAFT_95530 [Trichodelitschia bisporula]|uniref:Uncharacterized protein n=1 Tax=Trichodelitschia bisporula TaxID=703511 RepID=A0A6G1HSU5_9PEZI|nr:hypothetical protein EJ06DRAFT_95530 [Trichodelitschia bisporula]
MDCSITIKNELFVTLTLVDFKADSGQWQQKPPTIVGARETTAFLLKDSARSKGTARYRADFERIPDNEKPHIGIMFDCPGSNDESEFKASGRRTIFDLTTSFDKKERPLLGHVTVNLAKNATTASKLESISTDTSGVLVRNTKDQTQIGETILWKADNGAAYEDNSNTSVRGSHNPVIIDVAAPKVPHIRANLTIDDHLVFVPCLLLGFSNNEAGHPLVAHSDRAKPELFHKAGTNTVLVTLLPPWASADTPWGIADDITWRIEVLGTKQVFTLNTTRLEFYAITNSLPAFYQKVVPVGLLRRFVLPRRDPKISWVEHCCYATFRDNGFIYDSTRGGASYAGNGKGGHFKLTSYLKDVNAKTLVNCYDQASIMQILLGLCPTTSGAQYVFMRPFGYIAKTDLIGQGLCNNPFYLGNQTAKLVKDDDPKRTAFGNHAFVTLRADSKQGIVDSCCGPHTGKETWQEYISAAIHTKAQTTLYDANSHSSRPGVEADIKPVTGVEGLKGELDTLSIAPGPTPTQASAMMASDAIEPQGAPAAAAPSGAAETVPTSAVLAAASLFPKEIQDLVALATAPAPVPVETRSTAALSHFFDDAALASLGWALERSERYISPDGTMAQWMLDPTSKSDDDGFPDDVVVEIFIARGGMRDAIFAFANHLTCYMSDPTETFSPPGPEGIRGQLNLESFDELEDGSASHLTLLWAYGNLFVRITYRHQGPHRNTSQVRELADKLQKFLEAGAEPVAPDGGPAPYIQPLIGPDGPVPNGSTFVVKGYENDDSFAHVRTENANVILLDHDRKENTFTFYAVSPGNETITFSFSDPKTFHTFSTTLNVEVSA